MRHVDPGTGEIGAVVYIANRIDRSAVNSHAQSNLRMLFQAGGELHRALDGCFGVAEEDQRHAVSGW